VIVKELINFRWANVIGSTVSRATLLSVKLTKIYSL
jgi:hypothetical protein